MRQDRATDWTSAGSTGTSFADWTSVEQRSADSGAFRPDSPNESPSEPTRRTRKSYLARAARKGDPRFFFCLVDVELVPSRREGEPVPMASAPEANGRCLAEIPGHCPSAADHAPTRPAAWLSEPARSSTASNDPKTQTAPCKTWGCLVYIKQQLEAFVTCHQATIPANGSEGVLTDSRLGSLRATCLSTFP